MRSQTQVLDKCALCHTSPTCNAHEPHRDTCAAASHLTAHTRAPSARPRPAPHVRPTRRVRMPPLSSLGALPQHAHRKRARADSRRVCAHPSLGRRHRLLVWRRVPGPRDAGDGARAACSCSTSPNCSGKANCNPFAARTSYTVSTGCWLTPEAGPTLRIKRDARFKFQF